MFWRYCSHMYCYLLTKTPLLGPSFSFKPPSTGTPTDGGGIGLQFGASLHRFLWLRPWALDGVGRFGGYSGFLDGGLAVWAFGFWRWCKKKRGKKKHPKTQKINLTKAEKTSKNSAPTGRVVIWRREMKIWPASVSSTTRWGFQPTVGVRWEKWDRLGWQNWLANVLPRCPLQTGLTTT